MLVTRFILNIRPGLEILTSGLGHQNALQALHILYIHSLTFCLLLYVACTVSPEESHPGAEVCAHGGGKSPRVLSMRDLLYLHVHDEGLTNNQLYFHACKTSRLS